MAETGKGWGTRPALFFRRRLLADSGHAACGVKILTNSRSAQRQAAKLLVYKRGLRQAS